LPSVRKDEILMVGDSLDYDIEGAHGAGIHSLLVLSGNTKSIEEARSAEKQPDFIADDFVLR